MLRTPPPCVSDPRGPPSGQSPVYRLCVKSQVANLTFTHQPPALRRPSCHRLHIVHVHLHAALITHMPPARAPASAPLRARASDTSFLSGLALGDGAWQNIPDVIRAAITHFAAVADEARAERDAARLAASALEARVSALAAAHEALAACV